jgi:hypothetical protein
MNFKTFLREAATPVFKLEEFGRIRKSAKTLKNMETFPTRAAAERNLLPDEKVVKVVTQVFDL